MFNFFYIKGDDKWWFQSAATSQQEALVYLSEEKACQNFKRMFNASHQTIKIQANASS